MAFVKTIKWLVESGILLKIRISSRCPPARFPDFFYYYYHRENIYYELTFGFTGCLELRTPKSGFQCQES